ncbi:MAG: cytochrome bd quinol oxidase subunit 1 apoprotein [Acidobacteria bacterium]|nr:cytochrome bd quinol oxidase subunit 1 apoprotein [Acidobacteriota bacterium]
MPEALAAHRFHFAFTIMFHYLFPVLTMGLGVLIAALKTLQLAGGHEVYGRVARFWAKVFAITFAAGVVTGIPMEFQFGTNWARFSHYAGPVVGQTLFMEGVFAFFAESSFLGLFLFGERRVSPFFHWLSAVMVALGAVVSGFFIVATEAWMQHPVAYEIVGGRAQLTSLWGLLSNPVAIWQYQHVISGSMITASMVMAGVGAFYLLSGRFEEEGRASVRVGVVAGLIFSVFSLFPTGSFNGENVTRYQPIKMAAMEGLFETQEGAPIAIIGMPDTERRELMDPIYVPRILSYLAYGDFRAKVTGLDDYPADLHPPVELVYYAYHIMVGLGTIFIAVLGLSALLLWRGRLYSARWQLWVLMLAAPFPYVSNQAGWIVTEVGRQPWVVYGLLRTSEATSTNVTGGMAWFTLLGFMGLYSLIAVLYLFLFGKIVYAGPAEASHWELGAGG